MLAVASDFFKTVCFYYRYITHTALKRHSLSTEMYCTLYSRRVNERGRSKEVLMGRLGGAELRDPYFH